MTQGDKMIENGYREGNWTVDDFLTEVAIYESIIYGVYYVAPGISEDASEEWKSSISSYHNNVYYGFFSF